ncbi:hypothetical protein A3C34_00790 [Candidatus Amesbacteria bacterium RIFCSPHIGHO2_02_FULL_48_21]|uniref:Aspartate/glutamate/uridylate kinase domain-containing protein n=1 Tax=Candidatus Amesbacteria bacterium RIFOXYD1_FULL_47_9 TaxID=1797267 RepID=A0A1F4ZYN2_9BACT|nr:MAG: hypothetical protein A3C34_00790 [Candidatus Amesbacteria bacterium RIFCSPHIGHO2_02_FULL_48_21]OGD11475.1 MAG: hypothetical protein A2576_01125 [Candidatus Amesbacteria bacterium RIFOXYD1_FULL_47_9]
MIIIKLGGGLVAPKEWEAEKADLTVIRRLSDELVQGVDPGKKMVVVSGSGNYGHKAVERYGISEARGIARVRESARKIGEIVRDELEKAGRDAELIIPHEIFPGGRLSIAEDKTPVLYGDVIEVEKGKWKVWSGEKIIRKLTERLRDVEMIVQVSREEGVWDRQGLIIPEINKSNWEVIKQDVGGAEGSDVTGGMLHKVEESLEIERDCGVKTWIISGAVPGRLKDLLQGKRVPGTRVG